MPARALTVVALLLAASPGALRGEAEAEAYRVEEGDTLWGIAETVLGDPSLWPALYRANRDRIKDPREVYPGQRLTVPSIDPNAVRSIRREAEALLAR